MEVRTKFRRDHRDEDFVMNHRLISWGRTGLSTKSIQDPSRIQMATELEILPALPIACLTCAISGSRRYVFLLSFLHRWQTSATTFPSTVTSTQRSERFPILMILSRLYIMSESSTS